jgi:transposase
LTSNSWAHARRKFDEAIKASGGKKKNPKALEGLEFINKLYDVEKELKDKTPKERIEERLLRSKPLLEAFSTWLQTTSQESLPQTHLGKAISYCLKQWEPLNTFLLDGRLEIDNNRTERSIKAFVIARKNFLFCVAPYGAKASAITFSLIESAKENGLKPFEYLKYLLEELPNATTQDLDKFMPWSEDIPEHCRTPEKK